ncbi:MAG: response regulator, partial [Wujia sp.]
NIIFDDFFYHMDDSFEVQTTSTRFDDIISHLKYFNPDVVCCCINMESREYLTHILTAKRHYTAQGKPFVVICGQEELDYCGQEITNIADLILKKPISAKNIQEGIIKFLNKLAREAEERIAKKKEQQPAREMSEQRGGTGENSTSDTVLNPNRRRRILVVDDDPMMLRLLKEQLHEDYDVATAVSGKIALKYLESKNTDLVLLDYEMPGEDGAEVLSKIRSMKRFDDIPVIFLTGITDREKIQKVLTLRPQGYLLKPIDREKLFDTIRKNIK